MSRKGKLPHSQRKKGSLRKDATQRELPWTPKFKTKSLHKLRGGRRKKGRESGRKMKKERDDDQNADATRRKRGKTLWGQRGKMS